jgi:hypothetical protein
MRFDDNLRLEREMKWIWIYGPSKQRPDSTPGLLDALLPAGSINVETQDSRFCRFKTGLAGKSA